MWALIKLGCLPLIPFLGLPPVIPFRFLMTSLQQEQVHLWATGCNFETEARVGSAWVIFKSETRPADVCVIYTYLPTYLCTYVYTYMMLAALWSPCGTIRTVAWHRRQQATAGRCYASIARLGFRYAKYATRWSIWPALLQTSNGMNICANEALIAREPARGVGRYKEQRQFFVVSVFRLWKSTDS